MTNNIHISVVICTYNGEKYISEQIESVINQTLMPSEIIIGDDGSNDGTIAKVEEYREVIERKGIHFAIYEHHHLGPHRNFKATLPKSTCDFIAPCDQDDIWMPDKLEKCAKAMVENVDIAYCDEYILWEDGRITNNMLQRPASVLDQLFGTRLSGHLLMFRRKLLKVYNISPEITFDYGITIASSCNNRIAHVEEQLCYWRRHSAVVTTCASNHNPYNVIDKGKWQKWRGAIFEAFRHYYSEPVANRYVAIEKIITYYAEDSERKKIIVKICRCMNRQSPISIFMAGWYYMILRMQTKEFSSYNLRNKIGNMLYNFTYPAGWWYEYRVHKAL